MPETDTVRERSFPNVKTGRLTFSFLGDVYQDQTGSRDISGTQRTVSSGHPVSRLGKSDEDIGGDFETYRSEVVYLSHPNAKVRPDSSSWSQWAYDGPLLPPGTAPLTRNQVDLRSVNELNALGATAIARCSPVSSHSELLTSISETLKDGLPAVPGISTWQDRTAIAKGAGSEYLNAQFGWIPLLSDMKAALGAARNSAKLLDQFKRDAGRNVRRRYEFPKETFTEELRYYNGVGAGSSVGLAVGSLQNQHFVDGDESGWYRTIRETKRKTWFSGAFTYHMPANDTQVGKFMSAIQQYDYLFGVALTPDVVWNLTPWSWATDWFANTGDVLANVSDAMLYGQVLRYGYLMEQTTIIDRNEVYLPKFRATDRIESVVKTVIKRRIQANPFGFGITFDGLDAYQLSILAALGMTRGHLSQHH